MESFLNLDYEYTKEWDSPMIKSAAFHPPDFVLRTGLPLTSTDPLLTHSCWSWSLLIFRLWLLSSSKCWNFMARANTNAKINLSLLFGVLTKLWFVISLLELLLYNCIVIAKSIFKYIVLLYWYHLTPSSSLDSQIVHEIKHKV